MSRAPDRRAISVREALHWGAMASLLTLEAEFFRTLNAFVEPAVRMGFGSPWIVPVGAVVLETTGRRSGRSYRTPVLATEIARES